MQPLVHPRRRRRITLGALGALLVSSVPLALTAPTPAGAADPTDPLALTAGVAVTQNFDTLASSGTSSTLPAGWGFLEAGTNATNGLYTAGTGSSNAGDTYSFGSAGTTERALGGLLSGSLVPTIGAAFRNDTGSTITSLSVTYTGEQWRLGALNRQDRLDFQYSLTATSLSGGTWTDVDTLDFTAPTTTGTVGQLNGNLNTASVTGAIEGLNLAAGATIWIRWADFNASSNDDGLAIDDFSITPTTGVVVTDTGPTVVSVDPANLGSLAPSGNVTVTFSEPVSAATGAFAVSCSVSGALTLAVTGGGAAPFVLDPSADLAPGETCTLTVTAAAVTDDDANDPPDTMAADVTSTFSVAQICDLPYTPIAQIQGSGTTSPLNGQSGVVTEGVVSGDRQGASGLNGFFIQDTTGDGNAATSEGIFVFVPAANTAIFPIDVNVGDSVRVTGRVTEFQNQTEIDIVTDLRICSAAAAPGPVTVNLPETTNGELERYEGMLVTIPQPFTVQQNFFQGRYGQVTLGVGGRLPTPTDVFPAGSPGAVAQASLNARSMLVLDDGKSSQNPNPIPYIGADNTLRAGDAVDGGLTGHLDEGAINSNLSIRDYRIHPTVAPVITRVNARPATPPAVGGSVKVASFNVLNYFNGNGLGGGFPTARGANTAAEFARQRAKIIAAITTMDASVVGLMELENDPAGNSAIEDLVAGLNAATAPGTYAFVNTGVLGGDEIRVGLVYQPAEVTPVGAYTALTAAIDPDFDTSLNRPALAQAFRSATGGVFNVVVNHLKSKGSACPGDPDTGDGQGNCNQTRLRAAQALARWIATDPTGSGDTDYLVIGDLNSYGREDPILALEAAGFVNLVETLVGPSGYSYVFDGMSGSLDHALASPSLAAQVTGADEWRINADEPSVIDYNTEFKPQDLYAPTPFKSSDHDPVMIGLNTNHVPTVEPDSAAQSVQYSDTIATVTITATDSDGDAVTISASGLPSGLTFTDAGDGTATITGTANVAPGTYPVIVSATDGFSTPVTTTVTFTVTAEDARATYTGSTYVATSSVTSSTATVTLAATIRDITAVTGDPATDADAGDIRTATVSFVDRSNGNAAIPGCSNLPVGLVTPGVLTTGTATCNWTVNLGAADSAMLQVGIVVGGRYTRNSSADDAVVLVTKPLGSNYISGGASLVLATSTGAKAGDAGSKLNAGLTVKYNKSGKNLQGNVNIIFRRTETDGVHTYQIKATALSSLASNPATGTATFTSKATIVDITNPALPVSVDGNGTLQLQLTDRGTPGVNDSIAITLYNKSGGLWFTSAWNGTRTTESVIDGGNLVVK